MWLSWTRRQLRAWARLCPAGLWHLLGMLLSRRDAHPQQTLAPSCSCSPQMEHGSRHGVTVPLSPGPLRQCWVSSCDREGVGSVVMLGALHSAGSPSVPAPQGSVAGPPMSPKPGEGHTDTLRSQDRVAGSPKCLCNPWQGGRAGSQVTQISPCLRTGWQGPEMSLHPRVCACRRKREIITQKTVNEEALA